MNKKNKKTFIKILIGIFIIFSLLNFILASPTGGIITRDGEYAIHTFTSNGSFNISEDLIDVSILVVAGGGGGGGHDASEKPGAGGGAGGVVYNSSKYLPIGNHTVIIGEGGVGDSGPVVLMYGANGENSSFYDMIAIGGGGGASGYSFGNHLGRGGGSGGGSSETGSNPPYYAMGTQGDSNGTGYGNRGGAGVFQSSAGGGGAGFPGENSTVNWDGSNGGNGTNFTINGSNIYYAGGGSAGGISVWLGGNGGGGNGGNATTIANNGSVNTGGGGGGGAGGSGVPAAAGGNGGSGIVIIRYKSDIIPPNISYGIGTETNGTTITDRQIIYINVSASDETAINNITIYIYNSSFGIINSSNTTQTNLYSNFILVDETYYFNATACDTTNNCNWTETRQIILSSVSTGDTGTIGGGGGGINPQITPPKEPPIIESCEKTWDCGDWGECISGIQRRECSLVGEARCTSPASIPDKSQLCNMNETCIENWNCGWSACIKNITTPENCIDSNNCGTQTNKPLEQKCTSLTDEDCLPELDCGEWSECRLNYGIEGIETGKSSSASRICTDKNNCIAPILEEKVCLTNIDVVAETKFEEGIQSLGIFDKLTGIEIGKIEVYEKGNKTVFNVVLNSLEEKISERVLNKNINEISQKKWNSPQTIFFGFLLIAFIFVISIFSLKHRKKIRKNRENIKERINNKIIHYYHLRKFKKGWLF